MKAYTLQDKAWTRAYNRIQKQLRVLGISQEELACANRHDGIKFRGTAK